MLYANFDRKMLLSVTLLYFFQESQTPPTLGRSASHRCYVVFLLGTLSARQKDILCQKALQFLPENQLQRNPRHNLQNRKKVRCGKK